MINDLIFLSFILETEDCDVKKLKFIFKDPLINQSFRFQLSVNTNITGKELNKIIFDYLLKENPSMEGLELTYENIIVNTNIGFITPDKQLKSNLNINENVDLVVFISEDNNKEKFNSGNINKKIHDKIYEHKHTEETINGNEQYNKSDNFDLSSINTKGESYSNFEYTETKNFLRDINNTEKYNFNLLDNNIENDDFNEYLIKKQLYMESKKYFPKTMKYNTIPSLLELKKLSFQDLRKVENFTVFNKYGKIIFKDFTDITYLDLDKIIDINFMSISLYQNTPFPKVNEELNKPAIIEIYDYTIYPNFESELEKENLSITEEIIEEHKIKIEEAIKERGGDLIEFDLEKKLLRFEVPFFKNDK